MHNHVLANIFPCTHLREQGLCVSFGVHLMYCMYLNMYIQYVTPQKVLMVL